MTRRSRMLAVLGGPIALAAWSMAPSSCGSNEARPPTSSAATGGGGAGGDAGATIASSTASSGSTSGAGASGACEAMPLPPGVPEGWEEFTDWSCDCRFYVPGDKSKLPPPIAWDACEGVPPGVVCKAMHLGDGEGTAYEPALDHDSQGQAILDFRLIEKSVLPGYLMEVIADADGPVHSAIIRAKDPGEGNDPGCYVTNRSIDAGRFVLGIHGDNASIPGASDAQGALGGHIDDLRPTVVGRFQHELVSRWFTGKSWLMHVTSPDFWVAAVPWAGGGEVTITSVADDPEHLPPGDFVFQGDTLFWDSAAGVQSGISVWDPVKGTRPLIRWFGEYTKAAGGLGTDGKDMVWSYGEGTPVSEIYPDRSIMTAPYTTDAAALQPHRLRSQQYESLASYPWVVYCGYAMHQHSNGAIVVRISDGVAWVLPTGPTLAPSVPVGLTCDEAFALGNLNGKITIMRFRLDSLGPGIPPD